MWDFLTDSRVVLAIILIVVIIIAMDPRIRP